MRNVTTRMDVVEELEGRLEALIEGYRRKYK